MTNPKDLVNNLSLLQWIVLTVVATIATLIKFFWFITRYIRLQYRFARNLRRKIYFLKTSDLKNLQTEKDALGEIKIFNVVDEIKLINNDLNILQKLDSNSVFVVGYDSNFNMYGDLIREACARKIPVIIYAKQGEIQNSEHWKVFNSHICCDVANTTNRILVILLNTLMIA